MFISAKIRSIARLLCAVLLLQTAFPVFALTAEEAKEASKPVTYKFIGDMHLASFGIVNQQVEQERPSANEQFDFSKFNFEEVPSLSEFETLRQIFSMYSRHEVANPAFSKNFDHSGIPLLAKDIDGVFGQGKDAKKHILGQLDNTITQAGRAALSHMLFVPTTDIKTLEARQRLIKKLVESEELFNELNALLQDMKASEAMFMGFWKDNSDFDKAIAPLLSMSGPQHRKSEFRLGFFNRFAQSMGFLSMGVVTLSVAHLTLAGTAMASGGFRQFILSHTSRETAGALLAATPLTAFFAILGAIGFPQLVRGTRNHINIIKYLQRRLINAGTFVKNTSKMLNFAKNNEEVFNAWGSVIPLNDLYYNSHKRITDFDKLFNDLWTKSTFTPEPSFWSACGRILADTNRMSEAKEQFAPLLQAVGELDAYLSMAKLIKKHRNERVHYCFVNFIQKSTPKLKITNFWHPLIDVKDVVTNSVELGGAVPANILMTGSNTGGKSTILKSMLLSILLAQTFGIAPADEMALTPFHYLGCYLHIQDDVAAGNSLFKAEVLRAQAIMDRVKSLGTGQFAFLVIDELFTGTAAEKGQQAAYKVTEHLMKNENLTFVFATHFKVLTEMEQHHPTQIRNFKIDVYKDEQGNLVRPYKLEPGVSDQNIANEILQEEIGGDVTFN
jgi:DNA mismatch repair protein MutS